MIQKSGIVVLTLALISLLVLGCPQQAPPPAPTSPAGQGQMPAPAGQAQMTVPGGSAQMPAPAGTVPTAQPGTLSQDPNQIKIGMTPEQVQQIMGPPAQLYQQGFIEWKYPSTSQGKVDIRFQNNKVILVERY